MSYIGYVYKTTNLINGKIYIGKHQRFEFDHKYYGSGKILLAAIKKYGRENFKVTVLLWCKTVEELDKAEINFIKAFDARNTKKGYNIAKGGNGFHKGHKPWNKGKTDCYSKETLKKIGEGAKKSNHIWKATEAARKVNTGRKYTKEHRENISAASMGKPGTNTGKSFSDEHKRKISESNRGKHNVPMSEEAKEKLSEYWKGKPWSAKRRAAYERSKLKAV